MKINVKFIGLLFILFSIGNILGLLKHYQLTKAVLLGISATALLLLVPAGIVVLITTHSKPLAFLMATAWEFLCSYIAKIVGYPLWQVYFFAGAGGLVMVPVALWLKE
ncbi:hypothetical protein QDY65_09485 [Pyrococcus kukulkanii]|uniref:hypothetical protein n=1 Tax=Pyrococcus kukulkanii TaxID=1609559 RepID=UPI003561E886